MRRQKEASEGASSHRALCNDATRRLFLQDAEGRGRSRKPPPAPSSPSLSLVFTSWHAGRIPHLLRTLPPSPPATQTPKIPTSPAHPNPRAPHRTLLTALASFSRVRSVLPLASVPSMLSSSLRVFEALSALPFPPRNSPSPATTFPAHSPLSLQPPARSSRLLPLSPLHPRASSSSAAAPAPTAYAILCSSIVLGSFVKRFSQALPTFSALAPRNRDLPPLASDPLVSTARSPHLPALRSFSLFSRSDVCFRDSRPAPRRHPGGNSGSASCSNLAPLCRSQRRRAALPGARLPATRRFHRDRVCSVRSRCFALSQSSFAFPPPPLALPLLRFFSASFSLTSLLPCIQPRSPSGAVACRQYFGIF